jgi:hypothetical protein
MESVQAMGAAAYQQGGQPGMGEAPDAEAEDTTSSDEGEDVVDGEFTEEE